jgi:hypothetical protein
VGARGCQEVDSTELQDHHTQNVPSRPERGLVERFSHGLGHFQTHAVHQDTRAPPRAARTLASTAPATFGTALSGYWRDGAYVDLTENVRIRAITRPRTVKEVRVPQRRQRRRRDVEHRPHTRDPFRFHFATMTSNVQVSPRWLQNTPSTSKGVALNLSATPSTSAGATNRNTARGSMKRRISHGHAMRSTLGRTRVTQTVRPCASSGGILAVFTRGRPALRQPSKPCSNVSAAEGLVRVAYHAT